jgi:hypothetical protein
MSWLGNTPFTCTREYVATPPILSGKTTGGLGKIGTFCRAIEEEEDYLSAIPVACEMLHIAAPSNERI